MPIDELRKYRGINPKPADFDAYWERALAEMRAVDPQIEFVRSSFEVPFADCFDLYFTGVRGARIHAKYVRPKGEQTPHPAILQFHGYAGNSGDWSDKLVYAALGYSVFSMDVRGQGGTSVDTGGVLGQTLTGHIIRGLDDQPDNLLMRHIFLDTAQLAGIAGNMPEVDRDRIGAMGASQGGGLTIACASLAPEVRMLAPIYPFLSDYKRVWEMDLTTDAYKELRTYFRFFDPLHEREEQVFERLGYIDIHHLASRIQGEVLMAVSLMDRVCPPSTQFAVYNHILSPKQLKIYPDYGHEHLPDMSDMTMQFLCRL
jgi:cephalosporin-C deacetylase